MKRRVLNIAAATSMLFFVAVITLWVRSYRAADEFMLKRTRYVYSASDSREEEEPIWNGRIAVDSISSNRGVLGICHRHSVDHLTLTADNVKDWSEDYPAGRRILWDHDEPSNWHFGGAILRPTITVDRFGFFLGRYQLEGMAGGIADFNVTEMTAPAWFLALLMAILPSLRAVKFWRSVHRRAPGFCIKCGYSLTGNTSGVCPECGTAVPKASQPV